MNLEQLKGRARVMNEVFEKIKKVITRYVDIDEDQISMEMSLHSELGASSLDLMNIVVELEKMSNRKMPRRTLKEMYTVSDLVKWVY